MSTSIAVLGSLNMDLVARAPQLPALGETIVGRGFATVPGGKGANQAVAAARLGARVFMVGRVGADEYGRALRQNLEFAGVDPTYVLTDPEAVSGIALIIVDDAGQNTIVVVSGANARVSTADVRQAGAVIRSAQALIVQLETPLDAVTEALQLARAANTLTVLNPAPAHPLSEHMLELTDILVPNQLEASRLSGVEVTDWASAELAARALARRGPRIVVVTLGRLGALALVNGRVERASAFPVNVVDTTAAGDAFVAALTVAYADGEDLAHALRVASAAGALATTKLGAQPSLPSRAELDRFLETASPFDCLDHLQPNPLPRPQETNI